ncbi:hypothetical protein [Saccharopolyspora rectivirgula]|nr:hypothetical protein [Saccharopolyspora rectivirgula]
MAEQHGMDRYDATFARDLAWAQKMWEELDQLPTTDEDGDGRDG